MKIKRLQLIEGAKQAEGLTVIIDVFRAFSLECYLYDMGVKEVRPIGSIEDAFALHEKLPGSILVGERKGKKCEGFDFGNMSDIFEDLFGGMGFSTGRSRGRNRSITQKTLSKRKGSFLIHYIICITVRSP